MAAYKVPQDVEAEDKLIGPFSFRQFIYLIVVAIAIALGYFLGQLFLPLAFVTLPIILLFGALALPLRKDQPMEIYLTALIKFFLKPRIRLWQPEGQFSYVTITAPKIEERVLTKTFGRDEANERLSYLAQVIDTGGWASRGVDGAPSSLNPAVALEAADAEDVFDNSSDFSKGFSSLIEEQEHLRKEKARTSFQSGFHSGDSQEVTTPDPSTYSLPQSPSANNTADVSAANIVFNPYPAMQQHVVSPIGTEPAAQTQPTNPVQQQPEPVNQQSDSNSNPVLPETYQTSPTPQLPTPNYQPPVDNSASANKPSPDIMRLANNKDLSISGLAREAHRIEDSDNGKEVVISLR